MIIWNIVNEEEERDLEVGPITVLKGSHMIWYKLVRLIDEYFTNKNTSVNIYEDELLLQKKDWECLFIPYDAHLQIDKLNAKSPLKPVLEEVCEGLSYSPVYHELEDIWNELREELSFVNDKVEKYNLTLQLESFRPEHLKAFLMFSSIKKVMTPIEYKKLLLNLFADKVIEKNRLIIIELPELYANDLEIQELMNMINYLSNKGIRFLVVTQQPMEENCNYVFENKIINNARMENLKRKLINEVPFFCEDDLFNEAKKSLLKAVDNSVFGEKIFGFTGNCNEAVLVIQHLILHHLGIRVDLDTTDISSNLSDFVKSYS